MAHHIRLIGRKAEIREHGRRPFNTTILQRDETCLTLRSGTRVRRYHVREWLGRAECRATLLDVQDA